MTLGPILKELKKNKGVKQAVLADVLGVTIATISAYENDSRTPDIYTGKKIANFFNVSLDYLLENETSTINTIHGDNFGVNGNGNTNASTYNITPDTKDIEIAQATALITQQNIESILNKLLQVTLANGETQKKILKKMK